MRMLKSAYNGREFSEEDVCTHVGPGWTPILKELFDKLFDLGWDGSFEQVKEKFGGLRVYISNETDGMSDAIADAENKSLRTCESCGAPGQRHPGWGWIRTECHECNEKRHVAEGRPPFAKSE